MLVIGLECCRWMGQNMQNTTPAYPSPKGEGFTYPLSRTLKTIYLASEWQQIFS